MASVAHVAAKMHQPRGGYFKLSDFSERSYSDNLPFTGSYSITPGTLGMTVDYLSRVMLGETVEKGFRIALVGAKSIGKDEIEYAGSLADKLQAAIIAGESLSNEQIRVAVRLARYDAAYRMGAKHHRPDEGAPIDATTVEDIRTLVSRTVRFFRAHGPLIDTGITFAGAYCKSVDSGNADYLTSDTLWDLKTSKDKPKPKDVLQLVIYFLLSKRSSKSEFEDVKRIGFYNPRLNRSWTLGVADIDCDTLSRVELKVFGSC